MHGCGAGGKFGLYRLSPCIMQELHFFCVLHSRVQEAANVARRGALCLRAHRRATEQRMSMQHKRVAGGIDEPLCAAQITGPPVEVEGGVIC